MLMPDLNSIQKIANLDGINSLLGAQAFPVNIASDHTSIQVPSETKVAATDGNTPVVKSTVTPGPVSKQSSSKKLTKVTDFNVSEDGYRHEGKENGVYYRAAIEQQKDSIVEIKMKRVPTYVNSSDGTKDNLFTPASAGGYAHFFVQAIQTPKQERVQILETFTSSWIYLFGQMTPIYTFSGILLNYQGDKDSADDTHNWATDFMKVYDEQIRGTKAVEKGAILEIRFDNIIVQGYILNSNLMRNASAPYGVPFSFSMAITSEQYIGFGVFFKDTFERQLEDKIASAASKPKVSDNSDAGSIAKSVLAGNIPPVSVITNALKSIPGLGSIGIG
jgi:uncharacterized protein YxeA